MLDIEKAVRVFPRYHKYATGAELRKQIRKVVRLSNRAWRDPQNRAMWLDKMAWTIDELKVTLQLGKSLQAFRSFAEFEQIIRLAADLGRQCGGWQKKHPKGQSAAGQHAGLQRAQILSTRDASRPEANP